MKVRSREYKLMLDPLAFRDPPAVAAFWNDVRAAPTGTRTGRPDGHFDKHRTRTIVFLDTPDLALRDEGLVLRRRLDGRGDEVQYTLKCRSEDRYFAAGIDLDAGSGLESERKLEEDIAPPFRCRFSHSNTVKVAAKHDEPPLRLAAAARFYPVLSTLHRDGRKLPNHASLAPVNQMTAFERVYTGARLIFDGDHANTTDASVALILWSNGEDGSPLVAELSFRLEDKDESFTRALASAARASFELLQKLPLSRPDGTTKTEYVYGG